MIFSFKHNVIKQSQSFSTDFSRKIKAKKQIQIKPVFGKQVGTSPQSKFTHCNPFNFYLNDGDVLPTGVSVLSEVVASDHGLHYMTPNDITSSVMVVSKMTMRQ